MLLFFSLPLVAAQIFDTFPFSISTLFLWSVPHRRVFPSLQKERRRARYLFRGISSFLIILFVYRNSHGLSCFFYNPPSFPHIFATLKTSRPFPQPSASISDQTYPYAYQRLRESCVWPFRTASQLSSSSCLTSAQTPCLWSVEALDATASTRASPHSSAQDTLSPATVQLHPPTYTERGSCA